MHSAVIMLFLARGQGLQLAPLFVQGVDTVACAATGAQCSGSIPCCNATSTPPDHCEAVNQYYSKCVTQPKCAASFAQCAGKGQSVMEPTPCCDANYTCLAANEWYSSCQTSGPKPPPPPPPSPKGCAATGAQCGGQGFQPLPCCNASSSCEVVNQYYSKCVFQPTCAAENALCFGTGDHVFKQTPCCDTSRVCSPWGDDWSVCRTPASANCSNHGEQCAGTGGSAMKPKRCCDPTDTCIKINQYYSQCNSTVVPTALLPPAL